MNNFPEYKDLEFVMSEFNSGLYQHDIGYDNQDSEYASSFMIFQMLKLQNLYESVNNKKHYSWMSYWTFADIFNEDGFWSADFWDKDGAENKQTGGNRYFGMMTKRGIKKPVFNAFKLANQMGGNVSYNVYGSSDNDIDNTIVVFCLRNDYLATNKNRYSIFIANWNYLGYPIQNETIEITVNQGIDTNLKNPKTAIIYKVDNENSNAYTKWQEIGKPTYPTMEQLNTMKESAEIANATINLDNINATSVQFSVDIPVYGIAVVDIQY